MTLKISVPLHITGFFAPKNSNNPLFTGSVGVGLVIEPGILCQCRFQKREIGVNEVFFNGVKTEIEPIERLLDLLNFKKKISIKIFSPVPIGVGYGTSGACALAVSLIIHRFLNQSQLKAAKMAHIAEVKSLTGLGDVIAIFSGRDVAVRIKAGAPGIGQVKSFEQSNKIRIITADLRKKSTKKMLKSMTKKSSLLGLKLLKKFLKNPSLKNFFQYSQFFVKKMGFAKENFFRKLEPLKKYSFGFSVKKGVFFMALEDKYLAQILPLVKKISKSIHIFKFGSLKYDF